ncbi:unnamed protein product [Triticum turgidum subsp. durum]|uniref:Uncharacterized protein n=1 Tax=Triticum turgidum subsp. durum TaxID=4567 RepID=A0A9R0RC48_TRITD|nr:unnamed protein product [Triticum turgidum subsp. durum]
MVPATYAPFPLAQDQEALSGPPQTVHLGQAPQRGGGWRAWARRAYTVIALLAFTAGFAWAMRRTRRSPCDLAFVITAYYLVAVLCCCVRKLQLQRLDDDPSLAPERRRARLAAWAASALFVVACFAWAVYRARRRPRALAFVIAIYYLIAVLYCCLRKLELLRLEDDPAAGPERRRTRLAAMAVSVAQGSTVALSAADRMPNLALKLAVFGLTAMALGLVYFFIFSRVDGEYGRAQSERPLHEQSPEQRA